MLNKPYKQIDCLGKIDIKEDIFIAHSSITFYEVTIRINNIVATNGWI